MRSGLIDLNLKGNMTKLATSKAPVQSALSSFDTLPDSAHVRMPVVAGLHGISTATVTRWSKDGRLPAPMKRGGVTTWNVGDLRRAMASASE